MIWNRERGTFSEEGDLKELAWTSLYEAKNSLTDAYSYLLNLEDKGTSSYVKSIIEEVMVAMLELHN